MSVFTSILAAYDSSEPSRKVLDSVSYRVLHHAIIPVLVVH